MQLTSSHFFVPIAVETLGVFIPCHFFKELAQQVELATDDHFTHFVQCRYKFLWLSGLYFLLSHWSSTCREGGQLCVIIQNVK